LCNTATIPNALGLVASGKRSIRSGAEYAQYFDLSGVAGNEITLVDDGDVTDTIARMKKIVRDTLTQTKRIAQRLKGVNREATARNVWNFLYNNVQYTKDHPTREQLRTPIRTWRDRKAGVDCDCFSIFISSVLTNLGIPHAFRIAAYSADYQHVYVIVPKSGTDLSSYYTIDPVVDRFNYEAPPSNTKDFAMKTTMLNGFGAAACDAQSVKPITYVQSDQITKNNLVKTADVLKELNVPHATIVDENYNPKVVVQTKQGNAELPTVITAEQATQLKESATQSNTQSEMVKPQQASIVGGSAGGILATLFSVGGLCWWAFSPDKPALSGPPRSAQRKGSAPARKKMKSLHI
jgi:hypothetical protein